jgi:hypothetical protein
MSVSGKSDKTQIRCNYSSLLFPACSIYMSAGILRYRYVTAVNFSSKNSQLSRTVCTSTTDSKRANLRTGA